MRNQLGNYFLFRFSMKNGIRIFRPRLDDIILLIKILAIKIHKIPFPIATFKYLNQTAQNTFVFPKIITVYKYNILPASHFQTGIPRIRQTAILFVDDFHPTVFPGIFITNLWTSIRRAIIHQYHFQIPVSLSKNAIHTLAQIFFYIVHRHNDANTFSHSNNYFLNKVTIRFFNGRKYSFQPTCNAYFFIKSFLSIALLSNG